MNGTVPDGAREITTGQANRVWHIAGTDGSAPYVLKRYGDPSRAANEAAALTLLAEHGVPAPRLLHAGLADEPAWTGQTALHAAAVPPDRLLDELAAPLAAIHRIPGPHAGRLAHGRRHHTWTAYLHDRLNAYTAAAPRLAAVAAELHQELDRIPLGIEPRLLHHDLQPGHLVAVPGGGRMLLDWELAAYGDPLSDLARLAVRLGLTDPTPVLILAHENGPATDQRLVLYWHIHQLADAAFATDGGGPTSAFARCSRAG
ncbi:phosphotransferase family protein [Streptomyces syringium]|uniref:phosphotransferase family protein n=1 Tax=Streptomyces syringium TaxID=76729 RepID=UPI003451A8B7